MNAGRRVVAEVVTGFQTNQPLETSAIQGIMADKMSIFARNAAVD
jgi:hypothetical protein